VALWDASDRLIYFGPLSIGNFCGGDAAANGYLQAAIQSLRQPQLMQQRTDASFKTWDVVACVCAK
jgi:hypothetical protein